MEHYANGISIQRAVIKTPTNLVEQLLELRNGQLQDQYEFEGDVAIHKTSGIKYDLEKDILNVEKTFKREKSGITRDRASKMEKSIYNLKVCWNRLYADTQGS